MKRYLIALALGAAVTSPAVAQAADTSAATMATVVCRAPLAGEKPNDKMGSTALVCRHLNVAKVEAAMNKIHAMMGGMQASDKTGIGDAMTTISTQFTLPMYPGEYPSNEYQ